MVNTSKILTVSYGTFSCTLEGFDDSFEMMKAIAEYFRDLAQDDRYFGAEPPTPDAEMLARIAEREVSRRVEARQEQGAIVLRPSTAEAPVAPHPQQRDIAETQKTAPQPHQPEAAQPQVTDEPQPIVAEETALEDGIAAEADPHPEPASAEPVAAPVHPAAVQSVPAQDEDSIAAKLSRIRAVVSRAPERPAEPDYSEPDYSEDEHAEDFSDDTAASIAASLREADAPELDLPQAEDEDFEDDYLEDPQDPQLAADIAEAASTPEQAEPPRTDDRPTRVIRMKRADFEEAVADGQLEQDSSDTLSAEDEEDLLKELAEVERELNIASAYDKELSEDEEDEDTDLRSIFAEDEKPEPAPAQTTAPAKADTDVGRLMDKAEQEMDRPDGAHRRSAIAHLRAAVQATRAETEAGGGLNRSDDSASAYRDDLNRVVRPRRPRPTTASEEQTPPRRPAAKAAPLKLVAEQRVDAEAPAQSPVVRPRRVSMSDLHEDMADAPAAAASSSFVEYAEKVGVSDLPELMEAAAAYMSYVEGRQKFSRPQLMNKARQVEDYQFSREDGLRSFGQLLRQGKIEKLKGGRFTVSDELIGFKPKGARAAG